MSEAGQRWGGSPHLVDTSGQPLRGEYSSPPTGGGVGDHLIDIAGLKQNVRFLNWAVGTMFLLGLGAIIGSYLLLAQSIEDLGKDLDRSILQLSTESASQGATLSNLEDSLARIEGRIDADLSRGSVSDEQSE